MAYEPIVLQLFNADGEYVPGAKLYSYIENTTTPLAIFADPELLTPLPHPVVCDAAGRKVGYLDASKVYKFAAYTPDGSQQLIPTINSYVPREDSIAYFIGRELTSISTAALAAATAAAASAAEAAQSAEDAQEAADLAATLPTGPQGPAGPQGAVGPALSPKPGVATEGALPASGNTAGDARLVTGTGDLWVWVLPGQWENWGPPGKLQVRWMNNLIANAVGVINLTGSGIVGVSLTAPGVVEIRSEVLGAGAGIAGYEEQADWDGDPITILGFGGASQSQVTVTRNGRELLNTDWTGDTVGADYVVTINSGAAQIGDSVSVRIFAVGGDGGGGGGGGGAVIYRQNDAPSGNDGDLWFETDDQNEPHVKVSGSWTSVRDGAIGALDSRLTTAEAAITARALAARTISAAGLATGGGDLSANRTITVPAASQAEAEAGTNNTNVMTPLRVAQALAALGSGSGVTLSGGMDNGRLEFVLPGFLITFKFQWVRTAVAANTVKFENWSTPFSSIFTVLGCTYEDGTSSDGDNVSAGKSGANLSQVRIVNGLGNQVIATVFAGGF